MRVFDVPAGVGANDRAIRIVVHGTCRVHDPFEALASKGRIIKIWANNEAVSHTFGEARQMLAHCLGDSTIPVPLQRFVFNNPANAPPPDPSHRRVIEGADAYLVEVCERREIRYRDTTLQIKAFLTNFVSRHGNAVLPWYRALSRSESVREDLVADAMSKLAHLSSEEQELTASILREARLEPVEIRAATEIASELVGEAPWRWTFVPHFVIPGVSGAQMNDREAVRQVVSEVARSCGTGYFDPSTLIARHGAEKALNNGGKDIYHYSPVFCATVGQALLQQPSAKLAEHEPSAPSLADSASATVSNAGLVGAALNAVLISLHRDRVSKLGVDGSGLLQHYGFLLEQRTLLHQPDVAIAEILANVLPRFERYDVLQAGLGELAFLLSALGCRTIAFDPFKERNAAIRAGIEHLRDCQFPNSDTLDVGTATVPELTGSEQALAVACRLALTLSPKDEETMLRRLERYPAVLFNPATLIRTRSSATDQEELMERFRRAGFTHRKDFPDFGLVYCTKDATHTDVESRASPERAEPRACPEERRFDWRRIFRRARRS